MLTPVGEEIAERARLVLSDVDQIRAVARRAGDPADGNLRLGLFPTLAPYVLPHVIPTIRKRYPNLRLQLAEEKTEDILKMLQQGELDAALLALPVNDEGMAVEILFEEPFVLALPGGHSLGEKSHIPLKDLNGSELLLLDEGHCRIEHALEGCALAGAHERVDFHATSMETLRQMVAADVGITLMPILSVKPPIAKTDNVLIKRFARPVHSRTIAMIWRNSSALSEFIRELAACFKTLPGSLFKL